MYRTHQSERNQDIMHPTVNGNSFFNKQKNMAEESTTT